MGLSEEPTPACATPATDKKLETSRTGILVVTLGTLFLVSQLFLIIWILTRPHAFSRNQEQRQGTANSPSTSAASLDTNTNDKNLSKDPRKVYRSSTWSGATLDRQYLHQQKKFGGLDDLVGLDTPLSSSITDSDSDRSVRQSTRNMMGEANDMPMSAPPSTYFKNTPDSPVAGSVSELGESNPRKVCVEKGLVAAVIARPRSPRSPRLNAADQEAMMEALTADDVGNGAPSPTPQITEALASEYDDLLG